MSAHAPDPRTRQTSHRATTASARHFDSGRQTTEQGSGFRVCLVTVDRSETDDRATPMSYVLYPRTHTPYLRIAKNIPYIPPILREANHISILYMPILRELGPYLESW